ncbi:MAG: molybdopterin-dependent oxidoreductase [Coriobacteriia bacterium]
MRTRFASVTIALGLSLLLAGCGGPPVSIAPGRAGDDAPIELDGVEVREYEGERLDSVNDFRENSIKGVQYVDVESYRLEVSGLVETPETYTYSQVTSGFPAYEKVVQLDCVEGWSAKIWWRGVRLADVLEASGVSPEANTVIFHAADGYTSSLPLDYLLDNQVLLAYRMNGVTLPPERGFPFQLVAENRWGYKWVKWVSKIEVTDDPAYRGYWESRGYSNSGKRDESFFGD